MTTCIRRPSSFWTTCTCRDCTIERNRTSKYARAGLITRVSSEAAWEVVDRLLARGWTGLAIASAAGVPRRSLEGAVTTLNTEGRRARFGPRHSAAIVNHGRPTQGQVGATGARRRLRGLARQGWTLDELADRTGIGHSTLAAIRVGTTDRIGAAHDNLIRDVTDAIGMTIGPSPKATMHAVRRDWPGLLTWDDDTIDDPTDGSATGDDDPVDEVAVRRILNGDWRLSCSKADKVAVVAAWTGGINELARLTGWKVERYTTREDVPA